MKTSLSYPVDNENFVMGFRTQTEWRWLIPLAFFLGGLGGGLFMISLVTGYTAGALVGLLIAVVGKGAAHFAYLGNPLRFWRAVMKPQTSWISRGIIAMIGLAVFGTLWVAMKAGVIGGADSGLLTVIAVLAGISAAVVMAYDGFVIATPPSIPLWHSALMPILAATYSLLGGTTLALVMAANQVGEHEVVPTSTLHTMELVLVGFNFALLVVLLTVAWSASATARESVVLLLSKYSVPFVGGVIFVGLGLTTVLALTIEEGSSALLFLAACGLIGDLLMWFTILNIGVFQPINPRARFAR